MSWTESHGFSMFGQYNLTLLDVDKAWLNITNLADRTLWVYELSKDCFGCPYTLCRDEDQVPFQVQPGASLQFTASTKFATKYRLEERGDPETILENDTGNLYCKTETNMGEFGVYELLVENKECKFQTLLEPVSIYLPFLIPFFFYLCLGIAVFILNKYKSAICNAIGLGKKSTRTENPLGVSVNSESNKSEPAIPSPPRQRLRSLDTFRGICIVIMIFVNDGGAGYYFLEHATWDGLYVADLVFPWFLWIMGVCIPVSIKSQVKRNTPKLTILRRIIIRSLKLIAIGVILNSKGGPIEFNKLRLPGVLQRFGICYFVAATSVLICANKDFVNNRKAVCTRDQ
ncbi:unnamed protein product [Orchesella dallaii]|uniref:Heparan-alpha-glucosaminide N-acetyltransferase catalytic domain-containing protein n=1 Tax=Orchesella dallaii TaxID=48710 RepID=A0ABP1REF4_9HEXA